MASTVPTSCIQTESTVLSCPVSKAWSAFRALSFDKVAPNLVKSVVVDDFLGVVGGVVTTTYQDGGVWKLRITELSDRNYTIAYEVYETEPAATCTSIQGEIQLQEVTDENSTFLTWTTTFSNDADAQVMADQKYKKLDFFKAFKTNLK